MSNGKLIFSARRTAQKLRNARLGAGFTQQQLASVVSVSRSTISDWENPQMDAVPNDPQKIVALCNALDISPSELLAEGDIGGGDGGLKQLLDRYKTDPDFHLIVRLMLDLDGPSIRAASSLLESLGDYYRDAN